MIEQPPSPPNVRMPNLIDMSLDRALRVVRLAGVPEPKITLKEGKVGFGTVVVQEPNPGERLLPGEVPSLEVIEDNPIRHLPEVFQEDDKLRQDPTGAERPNDMLKSFLWIIQHGYSHLGRQVDHMDRQLSAQGASSSFLPWLLGLVPMEIDQGWADDVKREVLHNAPKLLQKRGTPEGLELMVQLHTGVKVKVHENAWPHRGIVVGQSRVGGSACVSTVPKADDAFYVELPPGEQVGQATLERILRIIDIEKPVHLRSCVFQSKQREARPVDGPRIGVDYAVGRVRIADGSMS